MDPITELEGLIDQLGVLLYTSIGMVQTDPPPPASSNGAVQQEVKSPLTPEQLRAFASDIVKISKTIETYVDSLPSIGISEEEQSSRIRALEEQNRRLEEQIIKNDQLMNEKLQQSRESLKIIAEAKLRISR
ncbi:mediator of RNA polymerase II transcription subunit 21-like [Schistocerca gregaria]|uniref:mediator of RNA polymerase II transcription subunit 21-like n=1 Tax=Schistocerca gregaria TaxID=7010 RepID=UPI00211DBFA9|nr:mediator of RNA polymerase II transcription subunit 21-like [Schistocerca gregaria]